MSRKPTELPPIPHADRPPPRERATALAIAAAAGVPLVAYLLTLHPGLPAGDSGELITAAWTGGVAHPPGYPLYVMLAGAWAHAWPFLTPALALNLFSALAMAAAAGVLALAVRWLTRSPVAAVAAAWAFAFARPVWTNAVVAEVFALNALLGAVALWLLVRTCAAAPAAAPTAADRTRQRASPRPPAAGPPAHPAHVLALLFVTVLGLSHHHTLLLLAGPAALVAFVVAWREQVGRRWRLLGTGVAAKLAALLPLLWLPFAAGRRDVLAWGDATTPRGFLSLLLRDDYGTFRLDPLESGMHADRSHLLIFLQSLPHAFGGLPLVLAAAGACALAARQRRVAIALAGYAALQALFFSRIGFPSQVAWLHGVVERFYILPELVLALLAGAGLAWARATLPRGARPVVAAASLTALLAVPVLTYGRLVDQRGNAFAEALGEGVLASLPPRAVVFVQGDLPHNSLAYLTQARHLRPDVTVIDQELLTYAWYVQRVRAEHPGLLPPLGGAQRIALRDGRRLDGWSIARADGSVDVLTEAGQETLPAGAVLGVRPAAAESLFVASRARFRTGWLRDRSEDRYSGLPGTRSLLWLDHLRGVRPVAFVGFKDESWSLRYRLTPIGFVALASPSDSTPGVPEQARALLHVFATTPMEAWFRAQDPASFEAAERWRFAAVAARAALVMSQPQAAAAVRDEPAGWARLRAFATRFEALEPTPDPSCLRAVGYLHLFGPSFVDHALARQDLERYLAAGGPNVAKDDEARATLGQLRTEAGPK